MNDSTPDRAEEDADGQLDEAVPSFGYGLIPVVGLAGAVGALASVRAFLEGVGERPGLAFVVVLQLPETRMETLVQQLAAWTTLPVVPVTGRLRLACDTVHVLPPGTPPHLTGNFIEPGDAPARARRVPADLFFRTLADSHGPHATEIGRAHV